MTLRTLNYGNYGIFLIMGNAGFCPSTVVAQVERMKLDSARSFHWRKQRSTGPCSYPTGPCERTSANLGGACGMFYFRYA